jgi:uncharacterized membrane-anchored protein YitT (DUF2179 family)
MTRLLIIFVSSILIAFSYNEFLLPHKILSSGVAGISMIVGLLTPINTGIMNFALNIPILILGYLKLGRKFILYTIFSVIVTSVALLYIPIRAVASDPILSSVFGGVLVGIAGGLVFRTSASTGGFDIIGLLLTRKKDFSLGALMFGLNSVVVFVSGFLFTWDAALYTMLSIFVTGKVVDTLYTSHVKLTLMIITARGEELKNTLISNLIRGVTMLDGEGAYTSEKRKVLFMVISRYELAEVKRLIKQTDPKAFVNITQTVEVMGYFRKEEKKN